MLLAFYDYNDTLLLPHPRLGLVSAADRGRQTGLLPISFSSRVPAGRSLF